MRHSPILLAVLVVVFGAAHAEASVEEEQIPDGFELIWGANPLSGVPMYTWWNGCSPTAGGMMVGYWDTNKAGYDTLFEGDSSFFWGAADGSTGTKSMIAGKAHNAAKTWMGHPADSLADFMHTVDGGTSTSGIVSGLEGYVEWDNPATATDESWPADPLAASHYDASVDLMRGPYYAGGTFGYDDFKAEIDAGRPMLLNLKTFYSTTDWVGHSVVGYGYQADMFQLEWAVPGPNPIVTVGGFAVMDTWDNGTAQSFWRGDDGSTVYSYIDGDGVEWWPFLDYRRSSFKYYFDWMVVEGIALDIQYDMIPEPTTFIIWSLLGALGITVGCWRRRRAA